MSKKNTNTKTKITDLQKKERPSFDVVICIPGKEFSNNWLAAWTNLVIQSMQDGLKLAFFNQYNPNLYYVRNSCLLGNNLKGKDQKPFNGIDYKYILWLDSDNIPNYNTLKRLISHDKDIVGALYKMADNKRYATVTDLDWDYYKANNSQFQFLTPSVIEQLRGELKNKAELDDFLLEVAYTGTGFLLIKQGVFEKIGYPWFRPVPFKVPGTDITDFMGDDTSLCMLAKEKGFKVHVDIGVEIGHEKTFII